MRAALSILFLLAVWDGAISQTISEINFTGLRKTHQEFLEGIINSEIGDAYNEKKLEEDVFLLKNLNLFFEVNVNATVKADSTYSVTFSIKEATYLYPILSVSGFKDQIQLEIGANQINFLGKGQSLGVKYLWYDRHSFFLFNTAPRHVGRKTGHEFSLTKYSTVEPLYFNDTTSEFNFDNYSFSAGLFYSFTPYITAKIGGMLMYEKYEQIGDAVLGLADQVFTFNKYQLRSSISYKKLSYQFERIEGAKSEFYIENIQTQGYPLASFLKSTIDFSYFKIIGKRGNFAIHQRLGISTNNFSPFAPFVLDGFINVRGIGNRIDRGTAEVITNVEYRHTLWSHKYFYLQGVGFSDFGSLRAPGAPIQDLFLSSPNYLFMGTGIRLHSRIAYNTILRVDFAANILNVNEHGFVFGFGHFF